MQLNIALAKRNNHAEEEDYCCASECLAAWCWHSFIRHCWAIEFGQIKWAEWLTDHRTANCNFTRRLRGEEIIITTRMDYEIVCGDRRERTIGLDRQSHSVCGLVPIYPTDRVNGNARRSLRKYRPSDWSTKYTSARSWIGLQRSFLHWWEWQVDCCESSWKEMKPKVLVYGTQGRGNVAVPVIRQRRQMWVTCCPLRRRGSFAVLGKMWQGKATMDLSLKRAWNGFAVNYWGEMRTSLNCGSNEKAKDKGLHWRCSSEEETNRNDRVGGLTRKYE